MTDSIGFNVPSSMAHYDITGPKSEPDGKISFEDIKDILKSEDKTKELLGSIANEAMSAIRSGQAAKATELKDAYFAVSMARNYTEASQIEKEWYFEQLSSANKMIGNTKINPFKHIQAPALPVSLIKEIYEMLLKKD